MHFTIYVLLYNWSLGMRQGLNSEIKQKLIIKAVKKVSKTIIKSRKKKKIK